MALTIKGRVACWEDGAGTNYFSPLPQQTDIRVLATTAIEIRRGLSVATVPAGESADPQADALAMAKIAAGEDQ